MLNQYIMDCLKENSMQLMQLEEKKKRIELEEDSCRNMIKRLSDTVDVGREFFSPRNSGDTIKQKIADIRKQLDELKVQRLQIEQELLEKKDELEKYEEMLSEIKKRESEKYQIRQLKKNPPILDETKEFKNVLARVEKCISYFETDKIKCKEELNHLKYYLKALLSEKQ